MLPECYIYVYDNTRDENRWVNKKYVEKYPKLYTPVQYHGVILQSQIHN
jgi:hypothetical protein